MLNAENLKTTVNYPMILALVGFHARASLYLSEPGAFNWIYGTDVVGYLSSSKGYVNTLTYFQKRPSYHDIKSHLLAIELLLAGHYSSQNALPQGDTQLRDTLCEYILNEHYNFRGHEVL